MEQKPEIYFTISNRLDPSAGQQFITYQPQSTADFDYRLTLEEGVPTVLRYDDATMEWNKI